MVTFSSLLLLFFLLLLDSIGGVVDSHVHSLISFGLSSVTVDDTLLQGRHLQTVFALLLLFLLF